MDVSFVEHLSVAGWPASWRSVNDGLTWQTISSGLSLVAYSAFAALLVWHTLHRFEIVAGRARRTSPPPQPQEPTLATKPHEVAGAIA